MDRPIEFPIDIAGAAKRRSLLALLNGLENKDQLGNGGLFPVSLDVMLADGQECSVLWFEDQPMKLVTSTNETAGRGCSAMLESLEMSAFLAPYLQYRK